jgi:adenosylhomocysteine nucleosidase
VKKKGIVCAMERELIPFLNNIENSVVSKVAMLTFHEGTIENISVVAVYSGVGKVNSAIATQILIDKFEVECIIFSGIAGGLAADINTFDTVVCTKVVCHDTNNEIFTDYHPWMPEPCFYADDELIELAEAVVNSVPQKVYFGPTTTGEIYVNLESSEALCIDMETIAVAHVCYVNFIPFIAIRSISDNSKEHGQEVINKNFDKASLHSYLFVVEMFKKLYSKLCT